MTLVEIRVKGLLGSLVRSGWPGCTVVAVPTVSVIRGRFGQGENLASVLAVLARHGLPTLDAWVITPTLGCSPDCYGSPRAGRSGQTGGTNGRVINGSPKPADGQWHDWRPPA